MSATAVLPTPTPDIAQNPFAVGDRVRLTAEALDGMRPAAREALAVPATVDRIPPKAPGQVVGRFDGPVRCPETERWAWWKFERHGDDANAAAPSKGAEVQGNFANPAETR